MSSELIRKGLLVSEEGKALFGGWAEVAFVAACARHVARIYLSDETQPASALAAVDEAISISMHRALRGGAFDELPDYRYEDRFLDNYYVVALAEALGSFENAALNCCADLADCSSAGPMARTPLSSIRLAAWALILAFPEDLGSFEIEADKVLDVVRSADVKLLPVAKMELSRLSSWWIASGCSAELGVPWTILIR